MKVKYKDNLSNIEEDIKVEVGKKFQAVLEDAGVYKVNKQGRRAFNCFMNYIGYYNL